MLVSLGTVFRLQKYAPFPKSPNNFQKYNFILYFRGLLADNLTDEEKPALLGAVSGSMSST
jgi:hypothetical protein